MPTVPHTTLHCFATDILAAAGLPPDQAALAAHHLVEANLVGHDSHGVIRVPAYAKNLREGRLVPVGNQRIVRETPASLVVDANHSFGIVLAYDSMRQAVARAKQHTFGAVAVHHSGHIGRLGAYPPLAVDEDCIGVVMLNGGAPFMAPYGGVSRRLPPNPIAVGVPVAGHAPMILDITTSIAAGGKVDVARARGYQLPDSWLVDADGKPVTDPNRFRDPDVAMLPFGGPVGYKGYGLALMIDALAGGLSWAGCSAPKPTRGASGYLALAINIASFIDVDEFKAETAALVDWVKSSKTLPGHDRIYVPGEVENLTRGRREQEGLPIEQATWDELCAAAAELNVPVPAH